MTPIRFAALLALFALMPGAAHAQTTLTACYVPKSGTVYRIKVEGAPTKCSQNHVEFSWQIGSTGISGYQVRLSDPPQTISSGTITGHGVGCQTGEVAVGGGYQINPPTDKVAVIWSFPLPGGTGWFVTAGNNYPADIELKVYAVCVKAAA